MTTTDPTTENKRQAYIEWLYQQSGRRCGTYTGLFQQRQRDLVERDMEEVLSDD